MLGDVFDYEPEDAYDASDPVSVLMVNLAHRVQHIEAIVAANPVIVQHLHEIVVDLLRLRDRILAGDHS